VALNNVQNVLEARKVVTRAFRTQKKGLGFSFVEMLSTCPTGWHKTPLESLEMIKEKLIPQYPLGEFSVPQGLE
jgi:2-oxoglutarate ferredoxin oxidoreductase subunit beta